MNRLESIFYKIDRESTIINLVNVRTNFDINK